MPAYLLDQPDHGRHTHPEANHRVNSQLGQTLSAPTRDTLPRETTPRTTVNYREKPGLAGLPPFGRGVRNQ